MMPASAVLSFIGKRVPVFLQHRVTSDARLEDLGLCPIDRYFSIPCDVEEQFGVEFTDTEIEAWQLVSDITAAVELKR